MTGRDSRAPRQALQEDWSHWTAIIALFARRRPARRRVNPRAYASLRKDLIATCRSLAETDGERSAYYAALEEIVRPWLSPRVFARTDREILFTLLHRCREVEQELTGRKPRPEWMRGFELGPILAAGVLVVGLVGVLGKFGPPVLVALRDVAETAWLALKFADDLRLYSVLAVIIIVAAMYVVSRRNTN